MALTRNYTPSVYFTKNDYAKRKKKAKKTIERIIEKNPAYKEVIQNKLKQVAHEVSSRTQSRSIKKPIYKPRMGIDFYQTREWLELRYQVIVKYGKTCQCCGSKKLPIHVDHIMPRSKFPDLELDINNLQILCEDCNIGKSNKDVTDWR